MADDSGQIALPVREATAGDISVMASHHRRMFEEIWAQKGGSLASDRAEALEQAYGAKLERGMAAGDCRGWVIEACGEVVASGAVSVADLIPTPADLSPKVAYLHSIYTEKSHRGRQCAQRIVETIIEFCRAHGIRRFILNASDAGRPIYERIGFRPAADMMRLIIE